VASGFTPEVKVYRHIIAVRTREGWVVLAPRLMRCWTVSDQLNPEGLDSLGLKAIALILDELGSQCDYWRWSREVRRLVLGVGR